ncbi:MAG: RagB/SusD family nutrient uptake outer membrane protein [Bacteroidota bacterium]|nr:RagB/SusD family nutrient uptake outer membrane protein [Bacteroidota bacterium]
MKQFIKISFLILLVFSISSCKKFLERPPEGQLNEEQALKSEADLKAFSNGIYTIISDGAFYGGRFQIMNELLGDHFRDFFQGDYAEIYKRQNSIFGGTRDGFYSKGYEAIARANKVLARLDLATTQKNLIEGEAKLFRGIVTFDLVRTFAQPWGYSADNSHLGIPLRTVLDLTSKPRSTVAQVYAQVIADLTSAEALLPDVTVNGKFYSATKWAAKAYLAKVYFQQNDFVNAYKYANEVIGSNKFMMDAGFTNRFSLGLSTEGILTIADDANGFRPAGELIGALRSDAGLPNFRFTDQYYSVATARAADLRRAAWYSNTLHPGFNVSTKYNKTNFALPIVHLTEIKLIRAEAGAETGGANLAVAIGDINQIMTRAYGGTSFNLPLNATAAAVIAASRSERELELVGEGNRTQEIKRIGARNGTNVDRRGSVWNCNGFILQFPKNELDANTAFIMNVEGGCF